MSIEKYIARCYWNLGENIVVKVVESRPSRKQISFSKNESRQTKRSYLVGPFGISQNIVEFSFKQ